MDQPCQHCGAYHAPEARFCRTCGAPLDSAGAQSGPISPRAQTIPLTNEARPTDGLVAGDDSHISYDTARVGLPEMERLLRRPQAPRPADEPASSQPVRSALPIASRRESDNLAAPSADLQQTIPALDLQQTIPAIQVPQAQTSAPTPSRKRVGLLIGFLVLGCLALGVGMLAFIISHRATSSGDAAATTGTTTPTTTTAPVAPVGEPNANAVAENQELTSSASNSNESAPAIELSVPTSETQAAVTRDKNEQAREAQRNAARDRLSNAPAQHAPTTSAGAVTAPSQLPVNVMTPPPSAPAPKTEHPADNDADAPYLRAFNTVNGRDLKKLSQAELITALIEFQKASRGGTHQEQARRYADLLGKEYDRRKNWTGK
jgi:hypothetical protein